MGICQNCLYFRSVKPKSLLLAQAIRSTDAVISNALSEISKNESQVRGYEGQQKQNNSDRGNPIWASLPTMSSYCAKEEASGIYLIPEIKNSGGRCTDFEPGCPPKKSCETCVYRVPSKGVIKDIAIAKELCDVAGCNAMAGLSTGIPENLINKHREGANSRKAFEITSAYNSQGHLIQQPEYLDYCSRPSDEEGYLVCIFQNPHHACPFWQAKTAISPAPARPSETAKRERRFGWKRYK